jgi:hypothetical protein
MPTVIVKNKSAHIRAAVEWLNVNDVDYSFLVENTLIHLTDNLLVGRITEILKWDRDEDLGFVIDDADMALKFKLMWG